MRITSVLLLLLAWATAAGAQPAPLRVLTTELPPFFYMEDGEPAGIEYEILTYYAKANELELEIQWVGHWPELFPALEAGKGDLVAAACTITTERKKRFDFATPHFPVRMQLVERKGEVTTDLKQLAGARLGVLKGSTGSDAFGPVPGGRIVDYSTVRDLFRAVSDGSVRAIASESADAFLFLEEFQNLEIGMPLSDQQYYGFALPKGSPHTDALGQNNVRLKESRIYFRLVEKYLGKRAVRHFKESSQ